MYFAKRPSIREHTHTVDAKAWASPTGAGVVPGGGKGLRRQQGRRSPETPDGDLTRRQGSHSILVPSCHGAG